MNEKNLKIQEAIEGLIAFKDRAAIDRYDRDLINNVANVLESVLKDGYHTEHNRLVALEQLSDLSDCAVKASDAIEEIKKLVNAATKDSPVEPALMFIPAEKLKTILKTNDQYKN